MLPVRLPLNALIVAANFAVPAHAGEGPPLIGVEQDKLLSSPLEPGYWLGWSVDVDGDWAVVGAPHAHALGPFFHGAAFLYQRIGTSWTQRADLTPTDVAENDSYGYAVALHGDTAVVGSPGDDDEGDQSGSVYVWTRNGTAWSQQAKLTARDAAPDDDFGGSVAISGDTLVVGAARGDGAAANAGAAYVFVRNGSTWKSQAKLTAADAAADDWLGRTVAVDGDVAAAGALLDDNAGGENAGALYVFTRSGALWAERQKLMASDGQPGDSLGSGLALHGDTLIGGAPSHDMLDGAAYVFEYDGTSWSEKAKLTGGSHSAFGTSAAVEGDVAIVGAPFEDHVPGVDQGSAFVFTRDQGTWSQALELVGSDAVVYAELGWSVALSGDTALCGAPEFLEAFLEQGSTYVFRLFDPIEAFCFGTDAGCPCGNGGAPDSGCDNAQSTGGVKLSVASYAPDHVGGGSATLAGTGYSPATHPTTVVIRSAQEQVPDPFGDGLMCVGAPAVRFAAAAASGGQSTHSIGHGVGAGTFWYQLWYRNTPADFCDPSAAFNTSNGLGIVWP